MNIALKNTIISSIIIVYGLKRPDGRFRPFFQLTLVMVQPHLGQSDPEPDMQVVPQLEQVLAEALFPPETQPQL